MDYRADAACVVRKACAGRRDSEDPKVPRGRAAQQARVVRTERRVLRVSKAHRAHKARLVSKERLVHRAKETVQESVCRRLSVSHGAYDVGNRKNHY